MVAGSFSSVLRQGMNSVALCCLLFFPESYVFAQSELSKQTKLKAAYLFNFTKYIEWPQSAFSATDNKIVICLHRNPPLVAFMSALVENRKVGKKKRNVVALPFDKAKICHISFIQNKLGEANPKISSSVLVTDTSLIELNSPSIVFYQQQSKLRFEIHMAEIRRLKVTVSSELLKLARIR